MTARISHTSFSCLDAYALSEWWKGLLGYADMPGDPNEPGDEECMIHDPQTGARLLFIEVDELQPALGRVHLDLASADRTRDAEIEQALAHGATPVADRRNPDGTGWMVLADPAGNHFCIVRGPHERQD